MDKNTRLTIRKRNYIAIRHILEAIHVFESDGIPIPSHWGIALEAFHREYNATFTLREKIAIRIRRLKFSILTSYIKS